MKTLKKAIKKVKKKDKLIKKLKKQLKNTYKPTPQIKIEPRYLMKEVLPSNTELLDGRDIIANDIASVKVTLNEVDMYANYTNMQINGNDVEIKPTDFNGGFNLKMEILMFDTELKKATHHLVYTIRKAKLDGGKLYTDLSNVSAEIVEIEKVDE